ncbi:MAG: hypothetical protein Ta2A_22230 [Treponemataceae bacterium]|nr:MAG: hypothetical protein Ta2A_22230 [Treponemataceae bacterium]
MGQHFNPKKHLNVLLAAMLAFFALAITLVTIIAFASGKANPGTLLRKAEKPPVSGKAAAENEQTRAKDGTAFMQFDQIRAVLRMDSASDSAGASPVSGAMAIGDFTTVIVKPWFSYPAQANLADTVSAEGAFFDATAFYEELVLKKRKLRQIFPEYFARYSAAELLEKGEAEVKRELTELINAELTMGKITQLYMEEYIFF